MGKLVSVWTKQKKTIMCQLCLVTSCLPWLACVESVSSPFVFHLLCRLCQIAMSLIISALQLGRYKPYSHNVELFKHFTGGIQVLVHLQALRTISLFFVLNAHLCLWLLIRHCASASPGLYHPSPEWTMTQIQLKWTVTDDTGKRNCSKKVNKNWKSLFPLWCLYFFHSRK